MFNRVTQTITAGFHEGSTSAAYGHREQKRVRPDKCVQKVTLRFLFLNSLTLAVETKKKGVGGEVTVWHPLLAASPGGIHETNVYAQIKRKKTRSPSPPCLRRVDDAREASQHGGLH